MKNTLLIIFIFLLILNGCTTKEVTKEPLPLKLAANEAILSFFKSESSFQIPRSASIDTFIIDDDSKKIEINFSRELSFIPFRNNNVSELYNSVKNILGLEYQDYQLTISTLDKPIEELIPNFYRENLSEYDTDRMPLEKKIFPENLIENISDNNNPVKGLNNRNIVLWHSHGWYYNNNLNRWEWQRPRLFQTVEDLVPMSFTIPYLIPMLENAGAAVFVPRERDIQRNEAVVDNDNQNNNYIEKTYNDNLLWKVGEGAAFAYGNPPYTVNFNPFQHGTHKIINADSIISAEAEWIPDIPEEGYYSVSISYDASDKNINDAHYTVYHRGGETEFIVNQQIGGSTWFYLGKFKFGKGISLDSGKVVLNNFSNNSDGKIVSADAVRFGGGMGVVERGGSTSERAKFLEGARYWLQYAGMPDTLVYNLNETKNDYNDDYQSRGEYVNYLYGAPFGPNKDRSIKGLGIPIDLSLAFHTDAGITSNDTTIGTLAIYSIEGADSQKIFPDGMSRLANRDLSDIIQTQIVEDLRAKYDLTWNRRQLREAQYSEAVRPNVPSLLLELLSHQNFLDMKFMLDPRFRFDVSRAIYKGMLRFLSAQHNFDYAVQPLPVTHFSSEFNIDGNILLKWKPQKDPLEPTAVPTRYIVYTRTDDNGFDNGVEVSDATFIFSNIEEEKIYSFKITAVNDGGESFPSEILSVCKMSNAKKPVLIINGFDRISAPASINTPRFSGFLNFVDAGVPDKYDISFTGAQYDFDPSSEYRSNDAPGHGASHSNYETDIIAGNTFDFPFIHGQSIKEAGFSFVSCSDEAVMKGIADLTKYKFVDIILGEEKETHWQRDYTDSIFGTQFKAFPKELQKKVEEFCLSGGNLFISGAYIGSDLFSKKDSSDIKFANDVLKFNWAADHAASTGKVAITDSSFGEIMSKEFFSEDFLNLPANTFFYNTTLNDSIYAVESPDEITPVNGGETILRYYENKFSAATAYKDEYGIIIFGFPFETIIGIEMRNEIMRAILNYFEF